MLIREQTIANLMNEQVHGNSFIQLQWGGAIKRNGIFRENPLQLTVWAFTVAQSRKGLDVNAPALRHTLEGVRPL